MESGIAKDTGTMTVTIAKRRERMKENSDIAKM